MNEIDVSTILDGDAGRSLRHDYRTHVRKVFSTHSFWLCAARILSNLRKMGLLLILLRFSQKERAATGPPM